MKDNKDQMFRDTKIKALKELRRMMEDLMLEDGKDVQEVIPKSMQKVTVAANSKKDLKKGLEKAESMLEDKSEMQDEEEDDCMPEDKMMGMMDDEDEEEDEE